MNTISPNNSTPDMAAATQTVSDNKAVDQGATFLTDRTANNVRQAGVQNQPAFAQSNTRQTQSSTPQAQNSTQQSNTQQSNTQQNNAEQPLERDQLEKMAQQLQEFMGEMNRSLQFQVDEDSGRDVIKVLDKDTGDIIKQYPSEEVLNLVSKLSETAGLLIDQTV